MDFKKDLQKFKTDNNVNDMMTAFANNIKTFLPMSRIEEIVEANTYQWLEKNKKSRKMLSKKARYRLHRELFDVHYSENKTYIVYQVKVQKKAMLFTIATINYVSTDKGLIYFITKMNNNDDTGGTLFCFYSHFFDRIAQRKYDKSLSRTETIKRYMWDTLSDRTIIYYIDSKEVKIIQKEGIILGNFSFFNLGEVVDEKTFDLEFISHNTFISPDMFNDEQKSLYQRASSKKLKSNDNIKVIYDC